MRALLFALISKEMNNQHLNEKKTRLSVDYFEKMHIIKNRKEDEVAIMLIQFNFKKFLDLLEKK